MTTLAETLANRLAVVEAELVDARAKLRREQDARAELRLELDRREARARPQARSGGMTFMEALATNRPMRRKSWWLTGDPGDRWLVLDFDGEWTWRDGKPASAPRRCEYLCEDWEVMPE